MLQLAPAASVPAQVSTSVNSVLFVPAIPTAVIVREAPPEFFNDTVLCGTGRIYASKRSRSPGPSTLQY
jgi:hypothetical protein